MANTAAMRGAAALIALLAWLGLAVQLLASLDLTGSWAGALWAMLRYYTILTNLAVGLLFLALAGKGFRPGSAGGLGGVTVSIALVGLVYSTLLRGLIELSGGARLADSLLHYVTPTLVPLFWLAFAPKGRLKPYHPLVWLCFLMVYFVYALARASFEHIYAYPFMNVEHLGWLRTLGNAAAIAVIFLLGAFGLIWLDRRSFWSRSARH
jgi:hypothetical protein